MSLVEDMKLAVLSHHPEMRIAPLSSTRHHNVLLLESKGKSYVAKSIWYDAEDPTDLVRAQDAFLTEVAILKRLPSWWSIAYYDSFVSPTNLNRIIITTKFPSTSWSTLQPKNYEIVARSIQRQLAWLHSNRIAHDDLELKNILLAVDQKSAVVIDFEKSIFPAKKEQMAHDIALLIENATELDPRFGKKLAEVLHRRRASIGGTRKRRFKK